MGTTSGDVTSKRIEFMLNGGYFGTRSGGPVVEECKCGAEAQPRQTGGLSSRNGEISPLIPPHSRPVSYLLPISYFIVCCAHDEPEVQIMVLGNVYTYCRVPTTEYPHQHVCVAYGCLCRDFGRQVCLGGLL